MIRLPADVSVVKGVARGFGASCEVEFWRGYPTLVNDPGMVLTAEPSLVGEGFAFFAQKVPAAMWFLGAWNQNKYQVPTHHHDPKFDLEEGCLPLGVELMANLALEYLCGNKEGG